MRPEDPARTSATSRLCNSTPHGSLCTAPRCRRQHAARRWGKCGVVLLHRPERDNRLSGRINPKCYELLGVQPLVGTLYSQDVEASHMHHFSGMITAFQCAKDRAAAQSAPVACPRHRPGQGQGVATERGYRFPPIESVTFAPMSRVFR